MDHDDDDVSINLKILSLVTKFLMPVLVGDDKDEVDDDRISDNVYLLLVMMMLIMVVLVMMMLIRRKRRMMFNMVAYIPES